MNKAGFNLNKNNEDIVLIVIGVIIIGFVLGLKPMYKFMEKLKSGQLFEKHEQVTPPPADETPKEEPKYEILEPEGVSKLVCQKAVYDNGGDKRINVTIYHTNDGLRSIKEEITYESISDEYSNYILSEQSKYKQRKQNNLTNKGYSVEVNLVSPSNLKVSSVYLLAKTNLTELKLEENDTLDVYGVYDENIYNVANKFEANYFTCEW